MKCAIALSKYIDSVTPLANELFNITREALYFEGGNPQEMYGCLAYLVEDSDFLNDPDFIALPPECQSHLKETAAEVHWIFCEYHSAFLKLNGVFTATNRE